MRILASLCAAAVVVAAPQPSYAACWSANEVAAARVRDFDTMLMVSALRCRRGDSGMLKKYNAMVKRSRAALVVGNTRLRAYFTQTGGGQNAFDRYVTRVANRYGAGVEGLDCNALASIADLALKQPATFNALDRLAALNAIDPLIEGERCEPVLTFAAIY